MSIANLTVEKKVNYIQYKAKVRDGGGGRKGKKAEKSSRAPYRTTVLSKYCLRTLISFLLTRFIESPVTFSPRFKTLR